MAYNDNSINRLELFHFQQILHSGIVHSHQRMLQIEIPFHLSLCFSLKP